MAHETSAGLRNALRAMYEAFDLYRYSGNYFSHLAERAFSRQDDTRGSLIREKSGRNRVGCRHLGRDVKSDAMLPAKGYHPPIGHDKSVHIRFCGDYGMFDAIYLTLEHYGVESQIGFHSAFAAAAGYFGQVTFFEVYAAARTHIESAEAEIDGIGTSVKRGLQTCEIACRREYLGAFIQSVRSLCDVRV